MSTSPLETLAAAIGLRHETVKYTEDGRRYRAVVTYGFDLPFAKRCNQAPHFTVTVDVRRAAGGRWVEDSGGADHELIRTRFPHLAPFIRWHLSSTDEPMHYAANGVYWYLMAHGRGRWSNSSSHDPIEALRNTILYGTAPGDEAVDLTADPVITFGLEPVEDADGVMGDGVTDEQVDTAFRAWLTKRFDAMMAAFVTDMQTLVGLREPEAVS